MGNSYFYFTDEAGGYSKKPEERFRRSHPFYIRSNVKLSDDDYRIFQSEIRELNSKYSIPVGEEIKWTDAWEINKGRYRKDFLRGFSTDKLLGYCRRFLSRAMEKESFQLFYTVTCVCNQPCCHTESDLLRFHFQEAFQRIQMDMNHDDFAVVIMDELDPSKVKMIKEVCHRMTIENDFVKYKNLYHGILTECSSHSAGVQLADYTAGILNGFLRQNYLHRGKYDFANEMYDKCIHPHLRHNRNNEIMGYGIREVPSNQTLRKDFSAIFTEISIDES